MMRVAVLSDIHSNATAFQACIDYFEQQSVDVYLLLGDYLTDTSETAETMALLYDFIASHRVYVLKGNREDYLLDQYAICKGEKEGIKWWNNSACGNLLYSYEQLSDADFSYFKSLLDTFHFQIEDFPVITCCHGSPERTKELLQFHGENTAQWMERIDTSYLLAAHTHFPGAKVFGEKLYINTGCIGIAIGSVGLAQCTLLHGRYENGRKFWQPEFLQIPYDVHSVIAKIKSSGLLARAPWFMNSNIYNLLTGIDKTSPMVAKALELAQTSETRDILWPDIPECYFEQAAKHFGIPDYR